MKKYEVIAFFTDLRDYDHPYNVGDEFPRQGVTVSEERIAELLSSRNKQRRPLIKAVDSGNQKPEAPNVPDSLKEIPVSEQTANLEKENEPGADKPTVMPESQENPGQDVTPDAPAAERNKYSKEDIEAMKLNQIREIAGKLGFKISSTSKDGAVAEFMEKQR